MLWTVRVKLEAEYADIEAEDEWEAFEEASELAMREGEWDYIATPQEEENE